MAGRTIDPPISLRQIPWWAWLAMVLLLLLFFLGLSSSGSMLAPLIGQMADSTNYLHEFTHDGRHLLGIPCH